MFYEENDDELFPALGSTTIDGREIPIRFVNKCPFPVDVFWMNFEKRPIKYGTLRQTEHLDIRTFKNHPWVARRSLDGVKLKINANAVFKPEPETPDVRTFFFITPKVLSLKEMTCRSLINENPAIVPEDLVSLPRDLQAEIRRFLDKKHEYSALVGRSVPPPTRRPAAQ